MDYSVLTSLLVQLGDQSNTYWELLECLKNTLRLPGQPTVYIIIDAIDECPMMTSLPSPREEFLEFIEELVNVQVSNLRICATIRADVNIVSVPGRTGFFVRFVSKDE